MNEQDETDSEWDSTLDFTSPRQTDDRGIPQKQKDIEDEEPSRLDSMAEKPKPKERSSVTPSNHQPQEDYPYAQIQTMKSDNRQKSQAGRQPDRQVETNPPPYNFRSAVNGSMTPQREETRPGKDRKGNTYDVGQRASQQNSVLSTGSWDDTDEDEKTLKEVRETFKSEKLKEQEAEEMRLRLESQAEEKPDEGQLTNRSEQTWKSWASFGSKANRSSNQRAKKKKKEGIPVATHKEDGDGMYDTVSEARLIQSQSRPKDHVAGIFQAKPNTYKEENHPVDRDTNYSESMPAMMSPPFIVKDDEGSLTYYFGHGPVQYLEVENEEDDAIMPKIADRLESIFTRIWQEFFGALRIVTSFFILMVVECFKYVIKYVLQPIFVGIFVTAGDYLIKPILTVLFNGFMQPLSMFCWNCCTTTKIVFSPIGEILRKVFVQCAMCCRSIRCIEINWKTGEARPKTHSDVDIKHV